MEPVSPDDPRRFAPATERNRDPILAVLQRVLPPTGTVLEIASGTGEHAVYWAPRLAPRRWLPTEPQAELRASIAAWQAQAPAPNLDPPIALQTEDPVWPGEDGRLGINAVVSINMIHISPWTSTLGLMAGAHRVLPRGGVLFLYGPFRQQGSLLAPSNEAFDELLRSQNPAWGLRELETVVALAAEHELEWRETVPMPAHNLSVIFERR